MGYNRAGRGVCTESHTWMARELGLQAGPPDSGWCSPNYLDCLPAADCLPATDLRSVLLLQLTSLDQVPCDVFSYHVTFTRQTSPK